MATGGLVGGGCAYEKPKQTTKNVIKVNVNDLRGYHDNPRHNNKSANMLAKSIKEFGYINLIVVDENLVILAGNTRHKALKMLGYGDIEVLRVSGLTENKRMGLSLRTAVLVNIPNGILRH